MKLEINHKVQHKYDDTFVHKKWNPHPGWYLLTITKHKHC